MKRNKREERISADFLKDVMKEIKMRKKEKKYKRLKMDMVEPNYQWEIDLADF